MSQKTVVTAALIYANGSVHIGHLVEYIQTDIYVRALKLMGEDAIYVCADDTHGTPIELNSAKEGITPEEFIARFYDEHQQDFARFDIQFDSFYSTNSPENKHFTDKIYMAARDAGALTEQEVDGLYCEHDKRFLPDRFVKGTCPNPKCLAEDQYGDVCEVCNTTYAPTDLKDPRCSLCNNSPVLKKSTHLFFELAPQAEFLAKLTRDVLSQEMANHVGTWIEGGLKPWCISRNAPYFGFEIPDREGKYFYVWFDAPIGYIASTAKYCAQHGGDPEADYWKADDCRIVHVIGKDIVYFHSLFWPAMLKTAGFNLPDRIQVHGFLTINGTKMSKSRGTFITARDFAEACEPEYLRYYYATRLTSRPDDIDLSFEEFQNRINAELVNKMANLVNRVSNFLNRSFDAKLTAFDPADHELCAEVDGRMQAIRDYYREFEFAKATREICAIADAGNLYFQERKPWELVKTDPAAAHAVCTLTAHLCQAFAIAIKPITPHFAQKVEQVLAVEPMDFSTELWKLGGHTIGPAERLAERFDKKKLDALVEELVARTAAAEKAEERPPMEPIAPQIGFDQFKTVDLRVAKVISAEKVKKSKKLLKLQVDIGEDQPRQIMAGIAQTVEPEAMVGRTIVVVANLEPAKLMGQESQGMLLAVGGDPTDIRMLTVAGNAHPGERIS